MGVIISVGREALEIHRQKKRSKDIDKNLREENLVSSQVVKLLLLGPGESGKSTVVKQMRILHDDGFTEAEVFYWREVIYSNTITCLGLLIQAMRKFGISLEGPGTPNDVQEIESLIATSSEADPFSDETSLALKRLWDDPGIQEAFGRRNQYQLPDSAKYFLNSLDRICESDYVPTQEDLLRARIRTTGIVTISFPYLGKEISVVDVGGQRSERRKWIHAFDYVDAIIFLAAISEFNQVIVEDAYTNRITETLRLFDVILNGVYFSKTSFILFLNKIDLFDEKIADPSNAQDFRLCFPTYQGEFRDVQECRLFVRERFLDVNATPERVIFTHFTCATDTEQIAKIVKSVMTSIIQKSVSTVGLN